MKNALRISFVVVTLGAALYWYMDSAEEPNPCDDGDPCTIDTFHNGRNQCINVPDALCTKPCKSVADCAYPEDVAPCLSASCSDGMCRYLKISRNECLRCSEDNPCKSTTCDPRVCTNGFCRKKAPDCSDNDELTWDVCDATTDTCKHLLVSGEKQCTSDSQCVTDHSCQQMSCTGGKCVVTSETANCDPFQLPRRCKVNTDCIQTPGGKCLAGPCENGFCRWREVPNSPRCKPCTGDHDCDGSFCEWPICTGTVCTVEQVPFCQDQHVETADICSERYQACLHPYRSTPPTCKSPPADDRDPATLDFCDTETGDSMHLAGGSGECVTTNKCWYTYLGPDGFCLGHPIVCRHDDACPAQCDPERGCVLDASRDCHCRSDADCDLGSPCARVFCIDPGPDGACWGTFINDCIPCKSDGDCRMDNWCVFGTCNDDGYCRYTDGFTCDDGDPSTFGFCHGQRDEPCTYEPIYGYGN